MLFLPAYPILISKKKKLKKKRHHATLTDHFENQQKAMVYWFLIHAMLPGCDVPNELKMFVYDSMTNTNNLHIFPSHFKYSPNQSITDIQNKQTTVLKPFPSNL